MKLPHAIVAGASSGIGAATVLQFVSVGYRVSAVSRDRGRLKAMVLRLPAELQSNVAIFALDLSESSSVKSIKEIAGPDLKALVVTVGSGAPNLIESLSDSLEASILVNVSPALNSWQGASDALEASSGSAVFVSSIAAMEDIGAPLEYSMAKATLAPLVRHLARKHAPVRVNLVVPGNVLTEHSIWQRRMIEDPKSLEIYLRGNVPLKRLADSQEIARLIDYLSSDAASFITGANFVIDGGQTRSFYV